MDNLKEIGLNELNKESLKNTDGGVKVGIGLELALDLENPLGISGILESVLGSAGGILG